MIAGANEYHQKHGSEAVYHAAKAGDTSAVLALLSSPQYELNLDYADFMGQTALHHAATIKNGDPIMIKALLADNRTNKNKQDRIGETPLHQAVRCRAVKIVQALLEAHVQVNISMLTGETALHGAARGGYIEIVSLLLNAPTIVVDKVDMNGNTALHYATMLRLPHFSSMEDTCNTILALLNKDITLVHQKNHQQNTPLHNAAMYGYYEEVWVLVKEAQATITANKSGKTPIDLVKEAPENPPVNKANILRLLEIAKVKNSTSPISLTYNPEDEDVDWDEPPFQFKL